MSGGLCKVHGTELNGFGSFSFCNACDAEKDETAAQRAVSEAAHQHQHGTGGGPSSPSSVIPGRYDILYDPCPTPRVEGWVLFGHQQPCQQRGDITLPMGTTMYLIQPSYYATLGAIYRIDVASVQRCHMGHDKYKSLKEITIHGDQLIYFNDRIMIGGIDHGPVP